MAQTRMKSRSAWPQRHRPCPLRIPAPPWGSSCWKAGKVWCLFDSYFQAMLSIQHGMDMIGRPQAKAIGEQFPGDAGSGHQRHTEVDALLEGCWVWWLICFWDHDESKWWSLAEGSDKATAMLSRRKTSNWTESCIWAAGLSAGTCWQMWQESRDITAHGPVLPWFLPSAR